MQALHGPPVVGTLMPSRKGRWNVPACPLCRWWTCGGCGLRKTNPSRIYPGPVCTECGGTEGSGTPVHHYNESVRAEHAQLFFKQTRLIYRDHARTRELITLADRIQPLINDFRNQFRASLRTASGDPDNLLAVNTGNEALLALEALVRDWVKNHPDRS